MIVIVNVRLEADGPSAYVLRVGEEIVCKFAHDRRNGLAECLREAAAAVDAAMADTSAADRMNELDAFPLRVEVRSDDDLHVEEVLAIAKNVSLAQAAYAAALKERPGKIVRLRIKARVIEEFIPG